MARHGRTVHPVGFVNRGYGIAYNPVDKVWVAVGNGNETTSIKFSNDNGKNWQNCTSGGFAGGTDGRGIAYNAEDKVWVAVGNGDATTSIKFSIDNGKTWQNCEGNGFNILGLGIAYNPEDKVWVAVGDNSAGGVDNNPATTIKFSKDNGKTWQNCTSGGFDGGFGGVGIAYNPEDKRWIAVGQHLKVAPA